MYDDQDRGADKLIVDQKTIELEVTEVAGWQWGSRVKVSVGDHRTGTVAALSILATICLVASGSVEAWVGVFGIGTIGFLGVISEWLHRERHLEKKNKGARAVTPAREP